MTKGPNFNALKNACQKAESISEALAFLEKQEGDRVDTNLTFDVPGDTCLYRGRSEVMLTLDVSLLQRALKADLDEKLLQIQAIRLT